MGFWDRITSGFRSPQPLMKTPRHQTPWRWSSGTYFGDYKSSQRVSFAQMRLAYEQNSIIRSCVDTILAEAENAEWDVVPVEEDASDLKKLAERHAITEGAKLGFTTREQLLPLAEQKLEELKEEQEKRIQACKKFFAQPNDDDDFVTFFHKTMHDVLVMDAGAAEKEFDDQGSIVALWPVAGESVRIKTNEHGQVLGYIQGEQVAKPVEFDEDSLVYFISNPRTSTPYGLSPIETLHREVATDLFQLGFTAKYFENNGIPPGILTLFGVSEEEFKRMLRQIEVQKSKNPSSVIVTATQEKGDMAYTPLRGQGDNDSKGYIELSTWIVKRICGVYRVAPAQIGYLEGTGGMSSNTSDVQKSIHSSKAVRPILNLFERKMTIEVIHRTFGWTDLKFAFTYVDPEAEKEEHERDMADLEKGALTINEYRKKHGNGPVPWGDVPYNPTTMKNWTEANATAPDNPAPPPGMPGMAPPSGDPNA